MTTQAYVVYRTLGHYAVTALDPRNGDRQVCCVLLLHRAGSILLADLLGCDEERIGAGLSSRFHADFLAELEGKKSGHLTVRRSGIEEWLRRGEVAA
jgi:hypothetical protein